MDGIQMVTRGYMNILSNRSESYPLLFIKKVLVVVLTQETGVKMEKSRIRAIHD